jgi:hypothetical protein
MTASTLLKMLLAEHIAQHPEQRGIPVDIDLLGRAVDL